MNTKDISFNEETLQADEFKTVFCDNWTLIKAGLEKVRDAIKNPVVKWLFTLVIDVSQGIYEKSCGAPVTDV